MQTNEKIPRKRTRDGYELTDGSIVKTTSVREDARNVHGLSKATLVRRLAYRGIRDPEILFGEQQSSRFTPRAKG